MAATTYFDHVIDPATGQSIEVCDKYAREQLVHKVEKTIVNSLPAKPTTYDAWLAMEPFLYWVPISGQPNEYQVWTLFFTGDPTDPSDYTDVNNYEWAMIDDTDVDLSNFSTKGHTHEVIPEVEVEDHDYTPQGQVVSEFEGGTSTTSENTHNHTFTPEGSVSGNFSGSEGNTSENTHNHSFTPEGSVSSSFSGSEGTTGNSTTGISITPDKKKLSTKKLNVSPATAVNFQGSTTNAQRATGNLEALSSYDAAKAVFNGIDVQDGVLSFVTKKMTTADTVSSLQGSIDASKVSFDSQGTVTNQDIATGGVENDNNGTLLGTGTTLSDSGHTHSFTPAGSVTSSFTGSAGTTGNHSHTHTFTPTGSLVNLAFTGTAGTTGSNTHTHTLQAAGSVLSAFRGLRANLKHKVDSKKVRTSPDEYDPSGNVFDWYGIRYPENASSRFKERIGNMDMHRMLPIQTKMRRCILNDDGTVNYYLDDRDSTKRAGSQEGYVTSEETFMSKVETDEIRDETEEIGVIKGNTCELNQLVDSSTTSVTVVSGHKYMSVINGTKNIATSSGTAITGLTGGTDMIFDLTLMGIDSFTTVEQVEAYLAENFGQRSYYPYNAGTLLSNTMKGIQTVGFNKWDGEYKSGYALAYADGREVSGVDLCGITDYIPVLPETAYYTNLSSIGSSTYGLVYYDANKNYISGVKQSAGVWSPTFTTPAGCRYIRTTFLLSEAGTICINISDPSKNGTYEPYNLHSYYRDVTQITGINPNTGVRELVAPNGLQKADMAGTVIDSIYNDSNGNAVCKKMCGDVDLGSLTWAYSTDTGHSPTVSSNMFYSQITSMKTVSYDIKPNLRCAQYIPHARYRRPDKCVYQGNPVVLNEINIIDTSYSDASTFKTAMSGVHLIYELATPILYTDLQWGDGSPVILPIEIEAEKNATIDIVSNFDKPDTLMAAPTLQMKKYVLTQGANLDGSDGQVMVEIPEHWRKVYRVNESGTDYVYAKISPYPQEGWHHMEKSYVGAFEASLVDSKLASTSAIVDLALTRNAQGKIVATCDLTNSRMAQTNKTIDQFRALARARNDNATYEWNGQTYQQWIDVTWLFFIEYATTNSQEPFKSERDANGFMQGGLGAGFSEFYSWSSYNNYYPVVPCGITACLGNHSGEVYVTVAGANYPVNSYRGIENPFGHLWAMCDGVKFNGTTIYRAVNPADFSNAEGQGNYVEVGTKGDSNGYVTAVKIQKDSGYDERFDGDITPTAVEGSTTTYYCDYYYQASGWRCCLLGGDAYSGAYDGFVCVDSNNELAVSYQFFASRLCFLPESE